MADQKLIDLPALASASADDLLYIVDDPGGTPISKKITVANLISAGGQDQIYPDFTTPVDGDFAWINQGDASVTVNANGGIYLRGPVNASTNWRIRKKAVTAPYTITAMILPHMLNVNFHRLAVGFRQSSDGKLHTIEFSHRSGTPGFEIDKWTNPTTFSGTYVGLNGIQPTVLFLRITDNNTNRICSFSMDGYNFIQLHSVGRTDFLTADEVFFAVDNNNATYDVGMTLLSWVQA